jgi:hypothetical protein
VTTSAPDPTDEIPARSARMPGIPVDFAGGPTIDPTKNVLDLVRAEGKYQDAMRIGLKEYQDALRDQLEKHNNLARNHDTIFQNYARDAEAKLSAALRAADGAQTDKLAELRQVYETRIAEMLSKSVDSTQALVANQLVQIQNTFNERVSKLEEFRWSMTGKTSVADPAIADAIRAMSVGLTSLKTNTDENMAKLAATQIEQIAKLSAAISSIGTKETKAESNRMGQGQVIAWIIGAAMLMAAIATPLVAFLAMRPH